MGTRRAGKGAACTVTLAVLLACGGEGESLRDQLARLPQDTASPAAAAEEAEEAPQPVDSAPAIDTGPLTLPDTLGFFDGVPAAPIQPDTAPRGLQPGPPSDTRPWIPEPSPELPPAGEWTTGAVDEPTANSRMTVLENVRTARNDGFDRMVFEFQGPRVPGFRVEYAEPPVRQCGSGQVVRLRGDSWLRVRLEPSQAHDDRGRATVEDRSRRIELPVVREMQLICDYEGQVEWVVGTAARRPFRVTRLSSPTRLIVDVLH